MQYQRMNFGKGKKRISLIYMNKPLPNGLVGMITSRLFSDKIAVIIDDIPEDERDYDFACLAWAKNGMFPHIQMSKDVYYDVTRGKPYARMILLHELGHYFYKDHLGYNEQRYAERFELVSQNKASEEEVRADLFAVDYLGFEIVEEGLNCLQTLVKSIYNEYDQEDVNVILKEIDMRKRAIEKQEHQ